MVSHATLIFTALFALLATGTAHAQNSDLEAHITNLFTQFETTPPGDELKALGSEAGNIIEAMARDESNRSTLRAQAIHALGYFPTGDRRTLLLDWAQDEKLQPTLRRKAVWALGNGWQAQAAADLEPLFDSDNTQMRLALVKVYATLPADSARPVLEARLGVEENETVRAELQRVIQ